MAEQELSFMLSVHMLNVVMLSVVATSGEFLCFRSIIQMMQKCQNKNFN